MQSDMGIASSTLLQANPELNVTHDKYNINVISESGRELEAAEVLREFATFQPRENRAHLYFHLPLCNYICKFCNYVKRRTPQDGSADQEVQFWIDSWQWEAGAYLERFPFIGRAEIDSLYFGGGTAALMSARQIKSMVSFARANYDLTPDAEISLEGNPDNFTESRIASAVEAGVNRFSVGVQSLDDRVLQYSGRGHSASMAEESIGHLARLGLPFNVDYMFGLPYQTPGAVESDIRRLIYLGAPTITIYRLRNADREKMGIGNRSVWNNDRIRLKMEAESLFPDVEDVYRMRDAIVGQFCANGYAPSPCGWWSKPGAYANGNIPKVSKAKWENYRTMLAYGPGAYGWLSDTAPESIQTHNVSDIHRYKSMVESRELPLAGGKKLVGYQALATRLGFGLKANQPISRSAYERIYEVDLLQDSVTGPVLRDLANRGLIEFLDTDRFKLSSQGETLHEEIISHLIHGKIGGFAGPICKRNGDARIS